MKTKAIFLLIVFLFSMKGGQLMAQNISSSFKFWENSNTPLSKFNSVLDSLFGDTFQLNSGVMSNTLFEKHAGGQGHALYGLKIQRKSEIGNIDSSIWLRPLAIVDLITSTDTVLNVALGVPLLDSLTRFGDFDWENMRELTNVAEFDSQFVADQYILPLPCNHFPIYIAYWGPGESTLSLDDDFADGLRLDQVIPFLEDQKLHFESYHGSHCQTVLMEVMFEIQTRHADIKEINQFVEQMTLLGYRLKVIYPTTKFY